MLRVVVYINAIPIIDTHAVRVAPKTANRNGLCTYVTDGEVIRNRFDLKNGAVKLAIKLLKKKLRK